MFSDIENSRYDITPVYSSSEGDHVVAAYARAVGVGILGSINTDCNHVFCPNPTERDTLFGKEFVCEHDSVYHSSIAYQNWKVKENKIVSESGSYEWYVDGSTVKVRQSSDSPSLAINSYEDAYAISQGSDYLCVEGNTSVVKKSDLKVLDTLLISDSDINCLL